jgi:histidine phosphotransferase ChpT
MPDHVRLAELMCARVCHDLGGLAGSLTGSLDLAQAPAAGAGAIAEAVTAAEELARRLRLLRAAWAGDGARLDLPRLRDLAGGAPGADRVQLDLSGLPRGTVFTPGIGRLLLNLLLLAAEALPRGGTVALWDAAPGGRDSSVLLRLTGPRAAWPAGFAGYLVNPDAARAALAGPRTVLGPWIALLAARLGIRASLLLSTGGRGNGPAPLLLEPAPPP